LHNTIISPSPPFQNGGGKIQCLCFNTYLFTLPKFKPQVSVFYPSTHPINSLKIDIQSLFFKTSFLSWINLPQLFFQKFTETEFEKIQKELEQKFHKEEKENIFCKACHHPITSINKKIEINGQHQHIFANPSGFSFKIGCFLTANGCVNHGPPVLEYTWFKGYSWRFALCSNCYTHLGWFYQSDNDGFYGLILENLEEKH